MPVNTPANMTTLKVESDIEGVAAALQTALRTLSVGDEIFDISYIRSQHSQGVVAIVSYEAAP
jgi:hypothetical protein